jgi:transposase InsO family protein
VLEVKGYRHLRQEGATRRKLGVSQEKIRCRWTRDQPGALWVGDFEHGPPVMHQGQSVKTHLSAWIDCHSRYVVEARYYIRENLDILVDSLLRAWGNHGASRELYVDNAKVYHAKALQLACTQLNIRLLHWPPRDPPAGGLIERFIQTCQMELEAEVRAGQILTLDDLNRVLAAWLAVAYHQEVHSETKQTPHERYHQQPRLIRQVDLGAVLGFFQQRAPRVVHKAFSDVRLENLFFAVDAKLRGDRVTFQRILTYTLNSVNKKVVQVLFLAVGLIMTRHAILTPMLMVIVMITGDFLGMSLTTDNVRPSPLPNAWRIGKLTIAGVFMGIAELVFCSAVLAIGDFGMEFQTGALRTLAFVVIVFGNQATTYAIRERRRLWSSCPSFWLGVSSVADILIASTLALGGIFMTPLPVLVVAGTLAAAVVFAFVVDAAKGQVFGRLGIA